MDGSHIFLPRSRFRTVAFETEAAVYLIGEVEAYLKLIGDDCARNRKPDFVIIRNWEVLPRQVLVPLKVIPSTRKGRGFSLPSQLPLPVWSSSLTLNIISNRIR
jgi:hypothetical protein